WRGGTPDIGTTRPRRPFPAATLPAAKTLQNFGEIEGVIGIFQSRPLCRLMAHLQAGMDMELKRKMDVRSLIGLAARHVRRNFGRPGQRRRPLRGNRASGASVSLSMKMRVTLS